MKVLQEHCFVWPVATPNPLTGGVKILEDQNNSNYTITSASRNDAGTYRCEAVINVTTLGQYSDYYTVQVTVRCKSTHNTYFYSFPWIVHLYILFTIMVQC